jgi:hypothetical protein
LDSATTVAFARVRLTNTSSARTISLYLPVNLQSIQFLCCDSCVLRQFQIVAVLRRKTFKEQIPLLYFSLLFRSFKNQYSAVQCLHLSMINQPQSSRVVLFVKDTEVATSFQSPECLTLWSRNSNNGNTITNNTNISLHSSSQHPAYVTPPPCPSTNTLSVSSEHSHIKRDRQDASTTPAVPTMAKRARSFNYRVPHTIPTTLISTMGTLATTTTTSSSNLRVHLRKQLSGSKMEQFLGNHDAMDVEPVETRPRSMSF